MIEEWSTVKYISILTAITTLLMLGVANSEIVDPDRSSALVGVFIFYLGLVGYEFIPEGETDV